MIRSMEQVREKAKNRKPQIIAVAVAQDLEVLSAVKKAKEENLSDAILVGDKDKIEEIAKENNISVVDFRIIDIKDLRKASEKAVELVSTGEADVLMKGLVDTSIFLKAVLHPEIGLRTGNTLSVVGVIEVAGYERLMLITDVGFNIAPDLMMKKQLIENSVQVANALEIHEPKVAVLCAKEKVNPKMPATVDAKELQEMNEKGEIKNCIVGGPLALDIAVSVDAAKHKGFIHPVAGKADILLVPNIETGNVLIKSAVYWARSKNAAVVVGAKAPIVITSRSDSDETKFNSIALAVLMASKS